MKREWFIIVVLFLVIVVILGSVGLTGLNVLYSIGNQGGRVNYNIVDINNFVQCFDADPQNLNDVKSVCHAQYYRSDEARLRGMNAIDHCKSKELVVDYYCARDFKCREYITECEEGFLCSDGRCIKKENELLKFFSFKDLGDSFGRTFGLG